MGWFLRISLVLPLAAGAPSALAAQRDTWPPPPEKKDIKLEWGVRIPLRDGLEATVSIYRPADQRAPLPVILLMTPYMADAFHPTAKHFAQRGYIVALADTRGRGHTDGEWKPFVQDGPDGHDIVEWLARQPWSDGQVGMVGISYLGFTQWTTLKEFPPHLATIVPTAPAYFSYTSLHPHNVFATYAIRWLTGVSGRALNGQLVADSDYWDRTLWKWYSNHLPYAVLDSVAGNRTTELSTWIQHPELDDYVERTAVKIEDYPRIDIPILSVTGYFDSEQRATMRHYRRHMRYGSKEGKARHYLILGPWDHVATFWPRRAIDGLTFDSVSALDMGTIHTQWYDWTLKGAAKPDFLKNRVAYYLMGAEEWRYADSLEAVASGNRVYHLGSPRENPSDLAHAGTLDVRQQNPGDSPDQWVYDPLDTRPGERGGFRTPQRNIAPADSLQLFGAGLVYETSPLAEPLDVAGYVQLRLWLSMDVPDTDLSVTLSEITRAGQAIFLTRQLQRARYREGLERARLMTPGEITPFVLDDFDFFARRIAAGSRIRLVAAALNSPRYEKNYNTGGVVAFESGKNARTARVNLHHDERHPSALELPIAAPNRTSVAADARPGRGARDSTSFPTRPMAALDSAEALFKAGRFPEAERLYAGAVAKDPKNHRAVAQRGRLALLSNRFRDAEKWLETALQLEPNHAPTTRLIAETHYRQDRFSKAAPLLRASGDELKARLLEGFKGLTPYQIEGSADEARLEFVQTDPIPIVTIRVNGQEGFFIIDTGGSEVYLEPEFAKRIGAVQVGAVRSGFAAGLTRDVQKGRVESLTLGQLTVRNVPVNIVDTKFIGSDAVGNGRKISGFIGTILLYHFLPTLDYPKGELVLRRKTERNLEQLEEQATRGEQVVVPFWMAGDHLMVTWASANRSSLSLFLIDTGGAGLGFVPGPSFVKEAGIDVTKGGTGRQETAGEMKVQYFKVDQVSLGPLTERDLPSVLGPFPAAMEGSLGFKLAGIISHEFFKHYALTIDFVGMRYFLKRGA